MSIRKRRSIRLQGYDYSSPGYYFVTICTWGKECLFGQVVNGEVLLSECGRIINEEWLRTPALRYNVALDEYQIMPNHIHGIIVMKEMFCRGVLQYAPTERTTQLTRGFQSPLGNVGAIVRGFKSVAAKRINILRDNPGCPVWQRNYYEYIIRSVRELAITREYIQNNALKWREDEYFK